jgi:HlyD family secretion protein
MVRTIKILSIALSSAALLVGSVAFQSLDGLSGTRAWGETGPSADRRAAPAAPTDVVARGRVEPAHEPLRLAIGIVGTLAEVYVNEGDPIKKGQLLATLVNDDQAARVAAAAATVELREAQLQKLMNGARPEERQQAAAELAEMKAKLVLAEQQADRRRPLAEAGVASREALDQAVSTLGVAQADTAARQASYDLIMAPPRSEDVAIDKANLSLARADLDVQRDLLEKTELRSPIDGVVLRRFLQSGETISIQPLIPILEVGDTSRLRVRAEIDETDVARVKLGQQATVTAAAYPGRKFAGIVSRIGQRMGRKTVGSDNPAEQRDTDVLDVLVDLDPDTHLPIGLRVDVTLEPTRVARD